MQTLKRVTEVVDVYRCDWRDCSFEELHSMENMTSFMLTPEVQVHLCPPHVQLLAKKCLPEVDMDPIPF